VTSDFINFTHILAADESVLKYLEKRKSSTQAGAKISLWGSYLDGKPIPDPYYGKIVSGDCHWFLSIFYIVKLNRKDSRKSSNNVFCYLKPS